MNKIITLVFVLVFGMTAVSFSKDNPKNVGNSKTLNYQIKQEIIETLNLPVLLKYSDKNLMGSATVTICICENGKVVLRNVTGENDFLNEYLRTKISSKNLWTDTKYSGNVFRYIINFD
jgi:hypothetical protein